MKKWLKSVDSNDILIVLGLMILGGGLAMVSWPLSLGVIGGLLVVFGLIGAFFEGVRAK